MKSCIKSIILLSSILAGGDYVCGVDQNQNVVPRIVEGRTIIATFNISKDDVEKDVLIINDSQGIGAPTRTGIESIYIYLLKEKGVIDKEVLHRDCNQGNWEIDKHHKFEGPGEYKICYLFQEGVTDMFNMFYGCSFLTSLDFSKFNTEKVTDMNNMCGLCNNLQSIEFGDNFNTNSVTDMSYMFCGCSSLTSLNVSKFKTDNVEDMSNMFRGCSSLTELNLSNFNTGNVTGMFSMFYECSKLTSLNLNNFTTTKVTDMSYMFNGCSSLASLNLSKFNIVGDIEGNFLFFDCNSLKTVTTNDKHIKNWCEKNGKVQVNTPNKEEKKIERKNNQNINNQNDLDVNQTINIIDLVDNSQTKSESKCCCCPCCKNR